MAQERLRGVVRGEVQGVGFRYFMIHRAQGLGLKGWVTNRDDGSVEFVAEGSRGDLEQLVRAAHEGPRMSRVEAVDVSWSRATGGLDPFDIS